jgi:hypothetical protein
VTHKCTLSKKKSLIIVILIADILFGDKLSLFFAKKTFEKKNKIGKIKKFSVILGLFFHKKRLQILRN